jgi:hypothetical protein
MGILTSLRALWPCVALALTGCATQGRPDAAAQLSAFRALPDQAQVRYAPGAEAHARQVAALLPAATARVEALHYHRFREPPIVHVCNDDACFHRFVAARWNFTAAVVYDNRLLLAPRLFEREPHRLWPVLLHELSHLHMGQFRGHYSLQIPLWFHEGMACLVASGGGADLVTDEQAWDEAARQRHFLADEQHLPWTRKRASTWGIGTSVFYRQAMLYLGELRSRDDEAFREFVRQLQEGADFDTAFAQTYQSNPQRSVQAFFDHAGQVERPRRSACAGSVCPDTRGSQ